MWKLRDSADEFLWIRQNWRFKLLVTGIFLKKNDKDTSRAQLNENNACSSRSAVFRSALRRSGVYFQPTYFFFTALGPFGTGVLLCFHYACPSDFLGHSAFQLISMCMSVGGGFPFCIVFPPFHSELAFYLLLVKLLENAIAVSFLLSSLANKS